MHALCPHCLTPGDLTAVDDPEHGRVLHCPNPACKFPAVPLLYGHDYPEHPPCPVAIVGLSGHGKTVFIDALLQEIAQLGGRWDNSRFYYTWLDEAQMRRAAQRLRDLRTGKLPRGTITVFQQPQVLRLSHVPRVGGCQLVLFDTGGEAFLDTAVLADAGGYVVRSPAVAWLLSLDPEEKYPGPEYANQMLTVYLQGMARLGGNTRNQDLVLTLTKADGLLARPDLPASARAALAAPSYAPDGPVWDALDAASADLEAWLRSPDCGYHNLVNLVRSNFRTVRYCVVSAQGAPASDDQLAFEPMPRGVLAPILWLWRLSRADARVGADLYLDLAEALADAPPGGTVHLGPGVFRLPGRVIVRHAVTVAGAGAEHTVVETTSPKYGLRVAADGRVALRDLTVRHTGPNPADVIGVAAGELVLDTVGVTGGRAGAADGRPVTGSGVVVGRQATAAVTGCVVADNDGNGLAFVEGGGGTVVSGVFRQNGRVGVFANTAGSVTLTRAAFRENRTGVQVDRAGAATVEEVVSERNAGDGAAFGGGAGAATVVCGCTCSGNGRNGVVVRAGATPTLRHTTCSGNRENGVRVAGGAPELEETTASGNGGCGLLFEDGAGGAARRTTVADNTGDGVRVVGTAAPRLEQTDARRNRGYGVAIAAAESAVAFDPKEATLDGNGEGPVLDRRPRRRWPFG